MSRWFPCIVLLLLAAAPVDQPEPRIKHAVIISIDGLRPDVLLRASAPRMRQLMDRGAFTLWARTTASSLTLPSHVSMLTGVTPEVHGIMWNGDLPLSHPVFPNVPTIFELAKRSGYSTALCAGKSKFAIFDSPGALEWKFIVNSDRDDGDVAAHAILILKEHQPDLLFVHFAEVDNVGHARGWGSPEQLTAVERVDRYVGAILDAIESQKLADSTFIILSSDHGGVGRSHGPEDTRSRTIPWIAVGPGIRSGFDLTRLGPDVNIDTFDTFATTCALMGIPVRRRINGKFVTQIMEKQELVLPANSNNSMPATQPADQ